MAMTKQQVIEDAQRFAATINESVYVFRRGEAYQATRRNTVPGWKMVEIITPPEKQTTEGLISEAMTRIEMKERVPSATTTARITTQPAQRVKRSPEIDALETLRDALKDAVRWLDAIESGVGNHTLVNLMPNNCIGRNDMRRVLEQTQPESSTAILNHQLRESIAAEDAKCLCVIGCSVNGACPLHGDAATKPFKGHAFNSRGERVAVTVPERE